MSLTTGCGAIELRNWSHLVTTAQASEFRGGNHDIDTVIPTGTGGRDTERHPGSSSTTTFTSAYSAIYPGTRGQCSPGAGTRHGIDKANGHSCA